MAKGKQSKAKSSTVINIRKDIAKESPRSSVSHQDLFSRIRNRSEEICRNLNTEDYGLQPIVDVSPPKWHLAHTTWFFETFILKKFDKDYEEFHPLFGYLFNSYYNSQGTRTKRSERGFLSRPTVHEVYAYRKYVNKHMKKLVSSKNENIQFLIQLGQQHEQQHQELMITDIKYQQGQNLLNPQISIPDFDELKLENGKGKWITVKEGLYEIGHQGSEFAFDNELGRHKQYIHEFTIRDSLVTISEYVKFIRDGGYENVDLWHSDGWAWKVSNDISLPEYWRLKNNKYYAYTLGGEICVEDQAADVAMMHVNFYEASAYAQWCKCRLPTEFEWETAAQQGMHWGNRWEWTNSAYLAYPSYKKAEGAIGEYNGKFMVNQMVLRGASVATPENHSRITYRNFFHPHLRWQFSGIRLCKD